MSKKRFEIFRLESSETLNPQPYKSSSIALLRIPSAFERSIASINLLISIILSVSGNFLLVLGLSISADGSTLM
jgi:hypothetical protein